MLTYNTCTHTHTEAYLYYKLTKEPKGSGELKIRGSLKAKHYIFVGVVGIVVFQSSGWLSVVKMSQKCSSVGIHCSNILWFVQV